MTSNLAIFWDDDAEIQFNKSNQEISVCVGPVQGGPQDGPHDRHSSIWTKLCYFLPLFSFVYNSLYLYIYINIYYINTLSVVVLYQTFM